MYYSAKTSRHRQNGLWYVPKKILIWLLRQAGGDLIATAGNRVLPDYHFIQILTWILREARGGLKATVDNRVKPDYHFIPIVFCSFLFLSARVLFSLAGHAQKHSSKYRTLWAKARLRFEEHI